MTKFNVIFPLAALALVLVAVAYLDLQVLAQGLKPTAELAWGLLITHGVVTATACAVTSLVADLRREAVTAAEEAVAFSHIRNAYEAPRTTAYYALKTQLPTGAEVYVVRSRYNHGVFAQHTTYAQASVHHADLNARGLAAYVEHYCG